jgi:hypothetical protein
MRYTFLLLILIACKGKTDVVQPGNLLLIDKGKILRSTDQGKTWTLDSIGNDIDTSVIFKWHESKDCFGDNVSNVRNDPPDTAIINGKKVVFIKRSHRIRIDSMGKLLGDNYIPYTKDGMDSEPGKIRKIPLSKLRIRVTVKKWYTQLY